MRTTISLLILAALVIFFPACEGEDADLDQAIVEKMVQEALAAQKAEQPEGVFIHISAGPDDPHRVLMPLQMAAMMSESRDVMVYFDIKGVEVVLKEAKDLTYAQFPSAQTQLQTLIDKGVTLQVCPGCLQAAGHAPEDVMAGVAIADKDKFFSFTEGRILTLDY